MNNNTTRARSKAVQSVEDIQDTENNSLYQLETVQTRQESPSKLKPQKKSVENSGKQCREHRTTQVCIIRTQNVYQLEAVKITQEHPGILRQQHDINWKQCILCRITKQ